MLELRLMKPTQVSHNILDLSANSKTVRFFVESHLRCPSQKGGGAFYRIGYVTRDSHIRIGTDRAMAKYCQETWTGRGLLS